MFLALIIFVTDCPVDNIDYYYYFNCVKFVNVSLNLQSKLWKYVHCYKANLIEFRRRWRGLCLSRGVVFPVTTTLPTILWAHPTLRLLKHYAGTCLFHPCSGGSERVSARWE